MKIVSCLQASTDSPGGDIAVLPGSLFIPPSQLHPSQNAMVHSARITTPPLTRITPHHSGTHTKARISVQWFPVLGPLPRITTHTVHAIVRLGSSPLSVSNHHPTPHQNHCSPQWYPHSAIVRGNVVAEKKETKHTSWLQTIVRFNASLFRPFMSLSHPHCPHTSSTGQQGRQYKAGPSTAYSKKEAQMGKPDSKCDCQTERKTPHALWLCL